MAEVELTSVPAGEARRCPRVDFSAQVELLARDELDDSPRVLVAQALDLGAGGIGLATRERLSVGTKVTCRLSIDGRDAAIGGHVAWLRAHTSPRPHGLGVCFDALADQERELLAHVVERTHEGYRPVELRFDRVQTPVIARARATPEGLRVSTPLPLLSRGAELAVRFEGEGQAFVGRISSVAISEHDGTPRLEVEVALSDAANGRFRRQARYGYADELTSAAGREHAAREDAAPAPETTDESTRTGRHAARPRRLAASSIAATVEPEPALPPTTALRVLRVLRIAGSLLLAAACGAALSAWLEQSFHAIDAEPGSPPAVGGAAPALRGGAALAIEHDTPPPTEPAAPEPPAAVEPPTAVPATRGGAAPAEAAAALLDQVAPIPDTPTNAAPAAAQATAALSQTPGNPATNSGLPMQAAAAELEPALKVDGSVTIVTIPFSGSLDGMRTTTWASPPAVAIDLPHGSAQIARSYYPLSGGIAAGLRVQQRGQQLLVRVMLAQAVSRIAVSAQREALEIRLTAAP